jgi:hypothetical protein
VKVSDGLDPMSKLLPIRMDVRLDSLKPGEPDCQQQRLRDDYHGLLPEAGGAARDSVRGFAFGVTSSPS